MDCLFGSCCVLNEPWLVCFRGAIVGVVVQYNRRFSPACRFFWKCFLCTLEVVFAAFSVSKIPNDWSSWHGGLDYTSQPEMGETNEVWSFAS